MAEPVQLLIEDRRWNEIDLNRIAQDACKATLLHIGLRDTDFEISLLACDDARISVLNSDFRDKPGATNVLSWPALELSPKSDGSRPDMPNRAHPDMVEELGDIAIAYETCAKEASQGDKTLANHSCHLIVHATLHLLGYDHIRQQDAELMEALETEILATLGIPDPY